MGEISSEKLFSLVEKGPSGRLDALEFCFKNVQMNKKNQDKIKILFEALRSDIKQLEHYIVMDHESIQDFNHREGKVFH